jgi:hypothetical protein
LHEGEKSINHDPSTHPDEVAHVFDPGGAHLQRDVGQAVDLAAGVADEVGVGPAVIAALPLELEAPDVIAQVAASHQTGLGEVNQVAVEGSPIEPARLESRAQLGVADRGASALERRQLRQARGGPTQPVGVQALGERGQLLRLEGRPHPVSIAGSAV